MVLRTESSCCRRPAPSGVWTRCGNTAMSPKTRPSIPPSSAMAVVATVSRLTPMISSIATGALSSSPAAEMEDCDECCSAESGRDQAQHDRQDVQDPVRLPFRRLRDCAGLEA